MAAPHEVISFINRSSACRLETPTIVKAQLLIIDPTTAFEMSLVRVDVNTDVIARGLEKSVTISALVEHLVSTDARDNKKSPALGKKFVQTVGMALVQECPILDENGRSHGSERLASVIIGLTNAKMIPVIQAERISRLPEFGVATKVQGWSLRGMFVGKGVDFGIMPATAQEEDGTDALIQSVLQVGVDNDGELSATPNHIALHTSVGTNQRLYTEDVRKNFAGTLGSILRYSV